MPFLISDAVADISAFLREAGAFALSRQKDVRTLYKDGEQAVTETDLAVSRLAHQRLSGWLAREGHVLVDEESVDQTGTPEHVFATSTYQWVLDPIDGTAGYALGRHQWGISLGLLQDGLPLAGGIFLPALRVMLLADDKGAVRIDNVGLADEVSSPLGPPALPLNSQVFVETYAAENLGWHQQAARPPLWMNTPESAVQGFFSALTGAAVGATFVGMFSIWDVAAALAIARHTHLRAHSFADGHEWARCQASDFHASWKLKEPWLLCRTDQYAQLRRAIAGA